MVTLVYRRYNMAITTDRYIFKGEQEVMSEQETAPDDKKQAETLKQIGNEFLGAGRLAEAIQCYSEAISLNNKNPVFYYNRAVAYDKMKQHDRAIKDCKQALKLDPLYSKAYGRMG